MGIVFVFISAFAGILVGSLVLWVRRPARTTARIVVLTWRDKRRMMRQRQQGT